MKSSQQQTGVGNGDFGPGLIMISSLTWVRAELIQRHQQSLLSRRSAKPFHFLCTSVLFLWILITGLAFAPIP